jgi:hypothetical protein
MSPQNARAIDDALGDLPLDDRLAALLVSIITRRLQAVDAVVSMVAVIGAMTRGLSVANWFALAELLRDCADTIERRATSTVKEAGLCPPKCFSWHRIERREEQR